MAEKSYYRNIAEIEGVEPESLWEMSNGLYVLVDDDQYIAVDGTAGLFYQVPDPFPGGN